MAEDLATTITNAAGQAATVRVGTVTGVAPLAIDLGGTALDMANVGVIGGGLPLGAPVILLGQSVQGGGTSGQSWVALGSPAAASAFTALTDVSVYTEAAAQTTSVSTYANVNTLAGPAFTMRVAKTLAATRLYVDINTSCFVFNSGNTGVKYGISIAGTDYEFASFFQNKVDQHLTVAGFRHLPGIPAGVYDVTLRWRRYTGAGDLNMDQNDLVSWRVAEVV